KKHRQARVPNERVLIDFTEKRILKGKRTYTFLAVDSCTRRLFTYVSGSKSMAEAIEFVKRLVKSWGLMKRIQLDNGTQFVYMLKRKYKKRRLRKRTRRKQNKFGAFCKELGIKLKFIPVGRPDKNAEVEREVRTLKEECLDLERFRNLKQVARAVNRFTRFYNRHREHGAHGGDTPLNVWRRKSIKVKVAK
ncbi:MAG TPA: integrase core domain-containing protein, partial [Candidatus Norongarragalinales archaeon]|nr:integrase core domain-containing protein [Candidatus Norongarragalinales archaeon]